MSNNYPWLVGYVDSNTNSNYYTTMNATDTYALSVTARYATCSAIAAIFVSVCVNDYRDNPLRERVLDYENEYQQYLLHLSRRYGFCWFTRDFEPYLQGDKRTWKRTVGDLQPIACCRNAEPHVTGITSSLVKADHVFKCSSNGVRRQVRNTLRSTFTAEEYDRDDDTACAITMSKVKYRCFIDSYRLPVRKYPKPHHIYAIDVKFITD